MTSQLFESASLEAALAEVRDTVGPHAKIVRAEKVRRGGIAGFFAKESFVLAVENDDAVVQSPVAVAAAPVRTPPVHPPLSWQHSAPADPYQDRFSAPMDTPAAYSLAALADFADRSDEVVESQSQQVVTETPVSTETPLFGQVLRDVSRATAVDHDEPTQVIEPRWDGPAPELDDTYRPVAPLISAPTAPVTPPVAPSLPPAVPYFQELVPMIEAAHPLPVREIPLEVYRVAPTQSPWWQTLAEVAETQAAAAAELQARTVPPAPLTIDLSAPRPVPPVPAPVQPTPPPAPLTAPVAERLGDELFPPVPELPEPVVEESAPEPEPVAVADPVVPPMPQLEPQLPTQHQSTAQLAEGLATINAALGPALLPGSVIAVVGHPSDANKVAARVAVAASADPFAIHIASQDAVALHRSGLPTGRQVSTLDEAILRSRRWPSRPTPLVVVIDGRDSQWARTVLDAIEATTVLALPSPAHHDDEVREWVAELGGVQALLVDNTCASTPEALALHGIPALRSPWSLESTRRVGAE